MGVKGGIGFAYEYAGNVFDNMSMDERMTVCNMSIEGGARIGYVNPDSTTFDYVKGREFAPKGEAWDTCLDYWRSIGSSDSAVFDDIKIIKGSEITPMVTWGITPGQSVGINENIPNPEDYLGNERYLIEDALKHMKLKPNSPIQGEKIDVVFVGSCTNSRLSDLQEAARILNGNKVHKSVSMIVVPGSQQVAFEAKKQGLDEIFKDAGADWREPGCSMCLAMNPDKLYSDQACASTSNRNFIGRQGSPSGRTFLVSPIMAAAAAIEGALVDVRGI